MTAVEELPQQYLSLASARQARRHDLVHVEEDTWRQMLRTTSVLDGLTHEQRSVVSGWVANKWPLIVSAGRAFPLVEGTSVGLPLPPSLGKLRLNFTIPCSASIVWRRSVSLIEASASAPPEWQRTISRILACARTTSRSPRVVGSLLWQQLTKLPFLHTESDLDLLLDTQPLESLTMFMSGLASAESAGSVRIDGEVLTSTCDGVSWRELYRAVGGGQDQVLVKTRLGPTLQTCSKFLSPAVRQQNAATAQKRCKERSEDIAELAYSALVDEVLTWPKPGLVSHIDAGSHKDMNAPMFLRSAAAIKPFFMQFADAGYAASSMSVLRQIGLEAEREMLLATHGVNTHRGAIFTLGLLCSAAGAHNEDAAPTRVAEHLLDEVRDRWGLDVGTAGDTRSHGSAVFHRYGAGGARLEASRGFPTLRIVGLPSLRVAHLLAPTDCEAARVQCFFELLNKVEDTNLLYRAGPSGLKFAKEAARHFLDSGGIRNNNWKCTAAAIHQAFISMGLSPGGVADLLASAIFLVRWECAL